MTKSQLLMLDMPLKPVPAPRPRVTQSHTYMPADSANYKADVQLSAAAAMQAQKLRRAGRHTPVRLMLVFYMPVPPSISKKGANERAGAPHTLENSDIDNLIKLVMDAMTDVVWVGDGQVYAVNAEKYWAEPGQPGRIIVNATLEHPD